MQTGTNTTIELPSTVGIAELVPEPAKAHIDPEAKLFVLWKVPAKFAKVTPRLKPTWKAMKVRRHDCWQGTYNN